GFEGVQVDGMDPLAMYAVTRAAREKALDPDGDEARPTLIEAIQYRYGAHTTADDPSNYRDDAEVEEWKERDPIDRFEAYLRGEWVLDDGRIAELDEGIEESIAELVDRAEGYEADPSEMFEHAFAEPTPRLADQREYLRHLREEHGDDALLADE
ncbi:MAG: thiamine pyrophosphate-dependent enzyme, partial [Halalkalicoccus sp.]|nr:thiamine pyrophosphate-dependent enzyme [Halalkalicoccus sp.]